MNDRSRFKFCQTLLYDEILNKRMHLKELCKQPQESQSLLKNSATWMKQKCKTYRIDFVTSKYMPSLSLATQESTTAF